MTMYKNNRNQSKAISMRIFCALLLGTCLLGVHQPVNAWVATVNINPVNKNVSAEYPNSDTVNIKLSGTATEPWQTALGDGAKATGNHATAIGAEAEATEQTSTALGNAAKAKGANATAVGDGAYATLGGSALGHYAYARGDHGVAFGFEAQTGTDSTPADGTEAIAIGYSAKAQMQRAIVIGSGASAEEENTTALGYKAAARGKNALALGSNALAHLENSVAIGYNSSVGAANSVSFGSSGATRRLMYVTAGTSETDAANFGQLLKYAELNGSKLEFYTNARKKAFDVELSSLSGGGGAGGTVISGGNVAYDTTGNGTLTLKSGAGTVASITGLTDKYTTKVELTGNTVTFTRNDGGTYSFELPASTGAGGGMSSLQFAGDDGTVVTKPSGQKLSILGGAPAAALSENNIGVVSDGGALKIKLAKDIGGISSLITESGVKIDADGLNAGNKKITGVADGTDPSDAVTVGQLNKAVGFNVNTIDADLKAANSRITSMDSKVNKVGAGAAALAALHPLDMDNKFDVAVGFGNYGNANAMALGVFYRPTENVMFSAGGAMGNGENMVNVGVSFALDNGEGVRVSKTTMAKKIKALTDENAAMKEKLAEQDTEIDALKAALARLEAKIK